MTGKAAIIGGGVIGGGWAARFLLNGWDVAVFDPDPEAERKVGEVLANARHALPGLYDSALPAEGRLSFHGSMSEAVDGAVWIQESVPERLPLKRKVFQTLQEWCDPEAIIGSSTSGFKPSELQGCATRPGQIVVTHPFNPVYLLPLIELVTTGKNAPELIDRAKQTLTSVGLYPLHLRREIDAHIADRFLEAVWREALWLVKDGIATTEEIDEAIRMGFGLRWAQMGLFETYRIAGGEAGMRHFLDQFGPCLSLPWTRLTDVPEYDEALVELIASQSDAQSGHLSIRELERLRDDNLVAMLRALKRTQTGAGGVILGHEATLPRAETGPDGLPVTLEAQVPSSFADYNGHMNEAAYLDLGTRASDRLMEMLGADAAYIAGGLSYFTVETDIRYLAEIEIGRRVTMTTQLLSGDGRKLHLFHRLWDGGDSPAATIETLLLHVDLATRRVVAPGEALAGRAAAMLAAHAAHPVPERLVLGRAKG
jgi:carnitine 3-dehydrogenase